MERFAIKKQEVKELMGIRSDVTLKKLEQSGKLRRITIGKKIFFAREDVLRLLSITEND